MKIVFLIAMTEIGGAEKALFELIAGLRQSRPEWPLHVISIGEGPVLRRARDLGVRAEALAMPAMLTHLGDSSLGADGGRWRRAVGLTVKMLRGVPAALSYRRRLRRRLEGLDVDLIHSNSFKMHLFTQCSKPKDSILIWHLHDYVGARPIMARLMRRIKDRDTALLANSRSVAEDAERVFGRNGGIPWVYNSVDLSVFAPAGPTCDLDALSGLPPAPAGTVRVGLLAAFARWKGHEVFLKALSLLPGSTPVRGYIIGGPIYHTAGSQWTLPELRGMASGLSLEGRVGFTGYVAQTQEAFRSLDIAVHASTEPEPFGLAIAEAMACGRAVIVSRAGGAAEITSPGEDSLAYRPGDAAELAECISELASSPEKRARIGSSARASAQRLFARADMTEKVAAIYEAAMRSHA